MRNRKKTLKENFLFLLKHFLELLKNFNFQILNLNMPRGITIIGTIVGIISLFLPWITNQNGTNSWNAFSPVSGNIGYIIIILLFIIIFLTFGGNYKEKMKLYSEIDLKNYVFIIFTGIFMFLISFVVTSFSIGLETFEKDFKFGNGLVLSTVSAILMIIGGYLTRKEFFKNSSEIILEKLNQNRKKDKINDNLSLPF